MKNEKCAKGGDIIELKIEKLTFQGAGLGRFEGLAVFVNEACPLDVLKVRLLKVNKNYAVGQIVEIIEPSPHRVAPNCALSKVCGGCSWQFVDYNFALSQKNLIVKEALGTVAFLPEILPTIKSPNENEFRHKVQYPIRETKVSKRILAGYFKEKTHEIVNIKHCPIQPKIADAIVDFIRNNWEFGAYEEKTSKGLLKNVALRISSSSEGILVVLVLNCDDLRDRRASEIENFASKLVAAFKKITGVVVNFNFGATNTILGKNFQLIQGENFIYETLVGENTKKRYKIGAESFFQTNPKCAVGIFDTVKSMIGENSTVLDAYGGVGAIGVWVADKAKSVVLVEENEQAVINAKENFKLNECKNYEVFLGDAKVKFNDFFVKKRTFDHIIIDPPRKGCEKGALEIISKLTNSIIYVSCNPQTLSRDIKVLEELGFAAKTVQPVDMFPYSFHIESVALIEKTQKDG